MKFSIILCQVVKIKGCKPQQTWSLAKLEGASITHSVPYLLRHYRSRAGSLACTSICGYWVLFSKPSTVVDHQPNAVFYNNEKVLLKLVQSGWFSFTSHFFSSETNFCFQILTLNPSTCSKAFSLSAHISFPYCLMSVLYAEVLYFFES